MTSIGVDVTVIVPAYNAEDTIDEQLQALRSQQFDRPFEVLIVDNGSTDRTAEIVRGVMAAWPELRLIDASGRRGSAHARNEGARVAHGGILAFCDADDVVDPHWLATLVESLTEGHIVFGSLCLDTLNEPHVRKWRGAPHAADLATKGTMPTFAPSSNMAMTRADYLRLGGMDESYPKSHDVEFSFRARAAGVELQPVPDAIVNYRFRSTLPGVFRQGFRSGRAAAQLYSQFRHESARRTPATTARAYWWLVSRTPFLLRRDRRGRWVTALGSACGHAVGSFKYRTWYF